MDSTDNKYYHSVTLKKERCVGCTDCIKRCPTEAIRVRNGKAVITNERCIDCGLCTEVCSHHAKKVTTDTFDKVEKFKYKIVIPTPVLYAQFRDIYDTNRIFTALKKIGFDEIMEVSRASELVLDNTIEYLKKEDIIKPVISSSCPTVTRLIQMRFPSLIENISPVIIPIDAAIKAANNRANEIAAEGLFKREEIGIFYITPCGAYVTRARHMKQDGKPMVDGVIALDEIYIRLRLIIRNIDEDEIECLAESYSRGIQKSAIGGERLLIGVENSISVDGVDNVIKVLEMVENGQLDDMAFIECLSCTGGCIGGALTLNNSFVAKNNLARVCKATKSHEDDNKGNKDKYYKEINFFDSAQLLAGNALNLDSDISIALKKLGDIKALHKTLPKIDCGSCGAPTCMALAEDIVQGKAKVEDCIFMLRAKVKMLANDMVGLAAKLPPSISQDNDKL